MRGHYFCFSKSQDCHLQDWYIFYDHLRGSQISGKWALILHIILLLVPLFIPMLHFMLGYFFSTSYRTGHLNLTFSAKNVQKKCTLAEVQMKQKRRAFQVLYFKCPSWRHGLLQDSWEKCPSYILHEDHNPQTSELYRISQAKHLIWVWIMNVNTYYMYGYSQLIPG